MDEGAEQFVKFVEGFYGLYPEMEKRKLHLTGESYAGKYLALFSHRILTQNSDIPLASTFVIDPYSSPLLQRTNIHQGPHALSIIDQNNLRQISSLYQKCQYDYTMTKIDDARTSCMAAIKYA